MFSISPQLTGVVLAAVIPMMVCVFALRYSIRKIFPTHRAKISNRTAFLVESIMGEKIIKSYNREELNTEIYKDLHSQSLKVWLSIVHRNELNTPIVEISWNLGVICLYGIALSMILNGNASMDAGTLVVFTSYMGLFSGPITQIAFIIQQLAQVSSNLEQVFDTINYPAGIENAPGAVSIKNIQGKVDFNHVTFSYDEDEPVLKDFDLHIQPGSTVALVVSL